MSRLNSIRHRAVALSKERHEDGLQELRRLRGVPVAREAGVDGLPESVDYDIRSPLDVVLSGPLLGRGTGPGRIFSSPEAAYTWAREKYGEHRVTPIHPNSIEEAPRWAVLVKNLRK